MTRDSKLPDYDRPPLVETVFSAQFEPLNVSSLHLAQFWAELRPGFNKIIAQPPLASIIEPDAMPVTLQPMTIVLDNDDRILMSSGDDTKLLQLQRDRFVFNWRSQPHSSAYPHFASNFGAFQEHLKRFENFCQTENFRELSFNQFELTYVNLIELDGTSGLDVGQPLFVDHSHRDLTGRFLPTPEASNWNSTFSLPDSQGRLHVSTQGALISKVEAGNQKLVPVVRVDLTARGRPKVVTSSSMTSWFECAHKWVVCGFADIVVPEVQLNVWGKR